MDEFRGNIQSISQMRLVEDVHLLTLHGGIGLTVANLREIFWIHRLRQLVIKEMKVCHGYKRFHALALQAPLPGLLLKDQIEGNVPFKMIRLNFTGAIKYCVQLQAQCIRPMWHNTHTVLLVLSTWNWFQTLH